MVSWIPSSLVDSTGAPVLSGAIAHFDCEMEGEHHAGSHSIFIGRVVSCDSREAGGGVATK